MTTDGVWSSKKRITAFLHEMLRYQELSFGDEALRDLMGHPDAAGRRLDGHISHGLWSQVSRVAVLVLTDLSAVVVAWATAYFLWIGPQLGQGPGIYLAMVPLVVLFPLSYLAAGLYPGFGLGAVETIRRLFSYTSICFLALAAADFVARGGPRYSRMGLAIAWIVALGLVPLFRFLVLSVVSSLRWWGEPTVVVGSPDKVEATLESVERAFSLGYRIVGVLLSHGSSGTGVVSGVPVLGGVELASNLGELGVTTALVSDSSEPAGTLESLLEQFRHVVLIREDLVFPIEQIRLRNLGGVLGMEFRNELLQRRNQVIKRAVDLLFGTVGLVLAAPVVVVCGLAVKILSPGPMFFAQQRIGLKGDTIRIFKLRTMYQDADRRVQDIIAKDPELARQWQQNFKLQRDPRVIPLVGNALRRLSIDELPQLWNVVKGEMSLVGPRPFPDYHMEMLPAEFRQLRCSVAPGLTGMWQVMSRSDGQLSDQIRYDTYYIRNWSLWFDLYLIARTGITVLAGKGAY